MSSILIDYLEKEWKYSNHKKYYKYFNAWLENLTENQIYYFNINMIKNNNKNKLKDEQ